MVTEKHTIKAVEDDYLEVKGNLSLLERLHKRVLNNEFEELLGNILEKNRNESLLKFFINKQSALNNTLHLIDESMSSLGDIEVEIVTDYPVEVIEWLTS